MGKTKKLFQFKRICSFDIIFKIPKNLIMPNRQKRKHISLQMKKKLVDLVIQEGLPINRARKELSMNYATAKGIMQKYNRTGKLTLKRLPSQAPEEVSEHLNQENQRIDVVEPNIYSEINPFQWSHYWVMNFPMCFIFNENGFISHCYPSTIENK